MLLRRQRMMAKKIMLRDVKYKQEYSWVLAGYFKNQADNHDLADLLVMTIYKARQVKNFYEYRFTKKHEYEKCLDILDNNLIPYETGKTGKYSTCKIAKTSLMKLSDYFTEDFKSLSFKCVFDTDLDYLLGEFIYWGETAGKIKLSTKENLDLLQAVMCLTGYRTQVIERDSSFYPYGINSPHYSSLDSVLMEKDYDFNKLKKEKKTVYCLKMPRGTLITRRNGKVSIQGNCDYSQCELRVAAWLSGDENMISAYNNGSDLHESTLNILYGDEKADPEKDHDLAKRQRTRAKISNFSLIYGALPKSLVSYAQGWGVHIPLEEAEDLHKKFFEAYPKLIDFYKNCKGFAKRYGYSITPTGRKRYLPDIFSSNFMLRSGAERQCINSPVQGMASDLCISALADIVFSDELDHSKFTVLGSIHDAILLEVKEDYAETLGNKVSEIMSNPSVLRDANIEMPVPLKGDIEIHDSWGG